MIHVVSCKDCAKKLNKTSTDLKTWKGRCRDCAVKELHSRSDRAEFYKQYVTKHGYNNSRLYKIWENMKSRVNDPSNYVHKHGVTISVCTEWEDFKTFMTWALDNGYSDNLSIDRIDNLKDYSPKNCRWASKAEQTQNRMVIKLNEYSVKEIRRLYASGVKQKDLALQFKIDGSSISRICSKKTWSNI